MNVVFTLFTIIILLPGLLVWTFYKFAPKLLWSIPVVTLLIVGLLLLKDIYSITSEPTFVNKWELYLHNDWSMGLYLIYLPIFASSVVLTFAAYLFKHYRKNPSIK